MVKLRQYSGESEDHNKSCSVEASPDALKMNGNAWQSLLVSGNCSDMMSAKENSFPNGNCSNNAPAKESLLVNGKNKASINETANGHYDKMSAKVPTVNGKSSDTVVNDVPTVNGNCGDEVPFEGIPMVIGKCNKNSENSLNGSNTPSEIGSSLCNEDNSDDNQHGFIEVVNKKKRNKKGKNHRKKLSPNLPSGLRTESIRHDNKNDKNCGEKTSPTHLSQKPPTRNFAAVRSSAKSYSSVLVNGQNGNSQSRNGGPNISTDSHNVTKCTKSNTSLKDCTVPGFRTAAQLSTELLCTVMNDMTTASCEQSNLPKKVEMTDVSAQTEVCSQKKTSASQKECLPSNEEVINESEKASTPSDYVDVGDISDESSNAAYCDSLVIKQGDGQSSNVENHGEFRDAGESNIELDNGQFHDAGESNIELDNGEFRDAGESNIELDNEWNGAGYFGPIYGSQSFLGNIVSNDSGRGDSEITYDESMPYCCEFPREKTSQLIGKAGNFKYEIEGKSGIKLWVYPHDFDKDLNIIYMIGTGAQIEKAKEIIKERFRHVTLRQWLGFNPINPPLSVNFLPKLPEGTDFMGVVSCICDPSFFWVQQYGHPHLYSLEDLERRMSVHFNTVTDAPSVENPTIGSVIAVPGVRDGDNVKWIRGWIINVIPDQENVVVRYLDHGGDHLVPVSSIRPMRNDFFSMPFFAAQCCLYDILPTGGVWSDEARAEFTRLCNSSTCPPIVWVMYRTPECYFVTMFGYDSEINARVDIASHLITKGFGVRPYLPATEFPSELPQ